MACGGLHSRSHSAEVGLFLGHLNALRSVFSQKSPHISPGTLRTEGQSSRNGDTRVSPSQQGLRVPTTIVESVSGIS